MNATWDVTSTGTVFHSFTTEGRAICRGDIKAAQHMAYVTEAQVDADIAKSGGLKALGYKKCVRCTKKEAAFRDRLEASMAQSTGEGDHLPPARSVEDEAITARTKDDLVSIVSGHYPSANGFVSAYSETDGELMGYTFRVDRNYDPQFGWVSRDGRYGPAHTRSEAASCLVRKPARFVEDEAATARTKDDLVSIVFGHYPNANSFVGAYRETDGELMGYTFQVRRGQSYAYGWVSLAGVRSPGLEDYRYLAVNWMTRTVTA